jgi:phytoene dehydrogenase-like protein
MHYTIVGAGIAGLTVAEGLLDRGHQVTLLERYPNVGGRIVTNRDPQYEIGAGRIHATHKRTHALIKRFKLHTYPIDDAVVYRPLATKEEEPTGHSWIFPAILKMLDGVSPKTLASHTLRDLLSPEWRALLSRFPYWAEVNLLRADLAAESFRAEMGTYGGYVGIVEGIDALTTHLRDRVIAKGATLLTRHRVADIRRVRDAYEITGDFGKKAEAKPFAIKADRVIIATCRCSLGKFSVLKGHPMLQQLQTSPLVRIYAEYPTRQSKAWFHDVPKTVTDSPLRFVIPINPKTGLIMISYTDGDDTRKWMDLEGTALTKAIQKEVKALFPEKDVPEPVWVHKHPWPAGCTYWTPTEHPYDIEKAMKAAMHPAENLWVTGESVARHQAWIESALTSAETLLRSLS